MVQTQMLKKLIFYSFSLLSHIFISLCLVPLILFLCHSHSHSQPHHASTCLVGHLASLTTLPCLHLAKLNPLYLFLLSLSLVCRFASGDWCGCWWRLGLIHQWRSRLVHQWRSWVCFCYGMGFGSLNLFAFRMGFESCDCEW